MARLKPVHTQGDTNASSEALAAVSLETWGFVPNSIMTFAHKPALLDAINGLVREIMLAPAAISDDLKWLVAHITSRAAGCRYCSAHTAHFGPSRSALAKERIEKAWEFETSPLFADSERAAMRVALGAGVSPNAVTDEQFEELHKHFDEQQIVEIISVIALFGFFNRWNDTVGTDLEDVPAQTTPPSG